MDHENKKKLLFESLANAEKSLQGSCLEQKQDDFNRYEGSRKRNRNEAEKYKYRDSLFKRPELPINKCLRARQRPEHERNPEKFVHYSLSDVTDTSDHMNKTAAFNFLREMEERRHKERGEGSNEDPEVPQKIVFKKSIKLAPKEHQESDKQRIINNKLVMPEYVVGQKKQKTANSSQKDKRTTESSAKHNLKLSHLEEEEDE